MRVNLEFGKFDGVQATVDRVQEVFARKKMTFDPINFSVA